MTTNKNFTTICMAFSFNMGRCTMKSICIILMVMVTAITASAQTWTGPAGVPLNTSHQYSYTHSSAFTKPAQWVIQNGSVTSSWMSANNMTAYCIVNWTTQGANGLITVKNGSTTVLSTYEVVVCPATMNTPTYSISNGGVSCGQASFTISATAGSGGTGVKWFTTSSGGTAFHTGTSYSTGTISSTTTYYISTYYTYAVCESSRVAVTITINSPPATPTYTLENNVCGSGTATITAAVGAGGSVVKWYNSSHSYLQTGINYITPSISSAATYYITSYNNTTGCESAETTVSVPVYALPSTPSSSGGARCGSGTVTLSATPGSGEEIRWYDTNDSYITTGNTYSPSLSATTSYRARARNTTTGCQSAYATVTATVNSIPDNPTINGESRCGTGTVTLSGPGGTTLRWYDASSGGTLLHTNTSYTTPSISATTTYYASAYNTSTGCEATSRVAVTATVLAVPAAPTYVLENNICGSGTATITASTGSGNVVKWYNVNGGYIQTGTTYTTPSLTSAGTYYISSYNSSTGCESSQTTVSVPVYSVPSAPSASGGSACSSGTVTISLSATPGSGEEIRWYDTNDAYITTGNSYSPSVSATTSYRARARNTSTGCLSSYTTVTATVNSIPGNPTINGVSRCGTGTVTLSGPGGTTLRWYNASSGGTLLHTNTSYTTPTLSATTTYYASAYNTSTGCEATSRVAVTATVLAVPAAPTYVFENNICGSGSTTITAATGAGNVVKWYNVNGGYIQTGITYTTPSLTSGATYYISSSNSSTECESSQTTVSVLVHPIPAAPTGTPGTRCGAGTVTISATPGTSADSIRWYSASIGGSQVGKQLSYTTPSVTQPVYYYAASYSSTSGCISPQRTQVAAIIKPTPRSLATGSTTALGSGPVTLSADFIFSDQQSPYFENSADTIKAQVIWYATLAHANANSPRLGRGVSYTTGTLTQSTSYYARVEDKVNQCLSAPVEAIAVVKPFIAAQSIQTDVVRVAGVKTESAVDALTDSQKSTMITYMDGVGRVHQQVLKKGSPNGKDVINPVDFDSFGRASKTYLPYVASTSDGSFRSAYQAEQSAFYQANDDKIANDTQPFAIAVYEDSPLARLVEQSSVGQAWQLSTGKTNKIVYGFNTGATSNEAEEVRKFNPDGTSTGFYGANILNRSEGIDADGNKVITFSDPQGNVIVTKQQLGETIDGVTVDYLETYYIYDDFGRVKYMIQPKGVAILKTSSWSLTTAIKDNFVFQYRYDKHGRVTEKKVPGAGWSYIVYDQLNRPVLMQDANLHSGNQWTFIKYDSKGRAIMTGLYTNTTDTTRTQLQNILDGKNYDGSDKYFEVRQGSTDHGYSNVVFPTTGTEILSVNYYDNHDFDYNQTDDQTYTTQNITGEKATGLTLGRATGSKTRVTGTTTWLKKYVFYDTAGHITQVRSSNHLNASNLNDVSTMIYDFEKVLLTKNHHDAGSGRITTVVNEYDYDTQGRAKKVYQKTDTTARQLLMQYEYNALGQVVDKKLHGTGTPGSETFMQSVDYRYNIRGQLTSINNAELGSTGDKNDDTGDYFGMELLYNESESGLSTSQRYNGNISAIKWKGIGSAAGPVGQKSYAFSYDKSGKLKAASSVVKGSSSWNQETGAMDEAMKYDHNGNIKTLTRAARSHQLNGVIASYTNETIDSLTYTYAAGNDNILAKVEDAAGDAGFKNGSTANTEFTYDEAGSVTSDANKGIDSVKYNFMGKPVRIKFSDGKVITYAYDAAGNKIQQTLYHGGTLQVTTDYVNGFVYENNNLSFFGSPAGRVVKNGSSMEYEYAIADHQGNTRIVFTSATPTPDSTQTGFESSSEFGNLNILSPQARMNHTPSGTTSLLLTGGYNSQVGSTLSFRVYPGDKVKAEVYAKYYNPTSTTGNLLDFASALTGAFGMSSGATGESLNAYNGMNNFGAYAAAADRENDDDTSPKGFVTILLFDKNYNFLNAAWDQLDGYYEQTGIEDNDPFDHLMKEVTVEEEGFVYIFVSNENPTEVAIHFDDIKVTHTKSNVIQYNEYYPFGMQASTSWTRENNSNNYLYNAANELNTSTGWYEMFYRGYDPAIGRMLQVDPLATSYSSHSPYHYGMNNPTLFNDPTGAVSAATVNRAHSSVFSSNQSQFLTNLRKRAADDWAEDFSASKFGFQDGEGFLDRYMEGGGVATFFAKINGEVIGFRMTGDTGDPFAELAFFLENSDMGSMVADVGFTPGNPQDLISIATTAQLEGPGLPTPILELLKDSPMVMLRMMLNVPDAISISINLDGAAPGAGVNATPLGILQILRGPDSGKKIGFWDASFAIGQNVGVAVVFTEYYYIGPSVLTLADFPGPQVAGSFAVSPGLFEGGIGFSISPAGDGGYIIGKSHEYGFSPEPKPHISWDFTIGGGGFHYDR